MEIKLPKWNKELLEKTVDILPVTADQFFEALAYNETRAYSPFRLKIYDDCLVLGAPNPMTDFRHRSLDYTLVWYFEEDFDDYGDNLLEAIFELVSNTYYETRLVHSTKEIKEEISDAIQEVLDRFI